VASRGKQIKGRLTVIIFFSLCLVFFSIADYIDEYEDGNNLLVYNLLPLLLVIDLFFFFRTLHVNPVLRKINLLLLVCQVVIYFLKYDYILEYRVFGSLFYIVFFAFHSSELSGVLLPGVYGNGGSSRVEKSRILVCYVYLILCQH
ncbi:MAG: hypothetical protein ACKOEV_11205, partial [Cytophagales bacterium]